jgi:hypothetical protein
VCVVDFTMLCASEIINPDHISLCFSKWLLGTCG